MLGCWGVPCQPLDIKCWLGAVCQGSPCRDGALSPGWSSCCWNCLSSSCTVLPPRERSSSLPLFTLLSGDTCGCTSHSQIFFPPYFCAFQKGRQEVERASVICSVGGSVLFFSRWLSGRIHCWAVVMALHNSLYMLQMWISAHEDALNYCFWICLPDPS